MRWFPLACRTCSWRRLVLLVAVAAAVALWPGSTTAAQRTPANHFPLAANEQLWTYVAGPINPGSPIDQYNISSDTPGPTCIPASGHVPNVPIGDGRGIAYDPFGNLWYSVLNVPVGGDDKGDGLIHETTPPPACTDVTAIPSPQPSIGAIDIDPDDGNLWVAGYDPGTCAGGTVFCLYKLNRSTGAVLQTCAIPASSANARNVTLAVAKLSGLGGSGKYLVTNNGGGTTLYAYDASTCLGGSLVSPLASATLPGIPGITGIDFESTGPDSRLIVGFVFTIYGFTYTGSGFTSANFSSPASMTAMPGHNEIQDISLKPRTEPCAGFPMILQSAGDGKTTLGTAGENGPFPNSVFAVSPYPGWANPPIGTSSWISPKSNRTGPATTYYGTSFTVSQYTLNFATLTLSGSFLADNRAQVFFNGQPGPATTGSSSANFAGPATTFTAPFSTLAPFNSNPNGNLLSFKVDDDGLVTGLDYSATVTCAPNPDLTIVKKLTSPTPWQVGGTYTFTTVVTNLGPGTVPAGAIIYSSENPLPAGLTEVSTNPSAGCPQNQTGTGSVGVQCQTVLGSPLSPGGTVTITWTVHVDSLPPGGKFRNCVVTQGQVTSNGATLPEVSTTNNNFCVDIPVIPADPCKTGPLKMKTYKAGKVDNFSLANGLTAEKAKKPIGFGAVSYFDWPIANRGFWHEFQIPTKWKKLCKARLQFRVKALLPLPAANRSGNDAIYLSSGPPFKKSWQQYFGIGSNPLTPPPPLPWVKPKARNFFWTFTAAGGLPTGTGTSLQGQALFARLDAPPIPGPPFARHRLDFYVQDDTSVDYIWLTVWWV